MSKDNNLDDFFANKDKSKKKSTKSSFTPDDIELLMEKNKNKKGPKSKRTEELSQVSKTKVEEDDGWNYYEEVTKDYSGLKIQTLAAGLKNGTEQESSGNKSGDEEVAEKDSAQGPWRAVVAQPVAEPEPEPKPAVSVAEAPKTGKYIPPGARQQMSQTSAPVTSEKSSGKYIPPALRNQAAMGSAVVTRPRKPVSKAPDVKNVEDFPSLRNAPLVEQGAKLSQNFEKVKGGIKQGTNVQNTASKISLNNKFGALNEGDS